MAVNANCIRDSTTVSDRKSIVSLSPLVVKLDGKAVLLISLIELKLGGQRQIVKESERNRELPAIAPFLSASLCCFLLNKAIALPQSGNLKGILIVQIDRLGKLDSL
jgi:hypothetical protein